MVLLAPSKKLVHILNFTLFLKLKTYLYLMELKAPFRIKSLNIGVEIILSYV